MHSQRCESMMSPMAHLVVADFPTQFGAEQGYRARSRIGKSQLHFGISILDWPNQPVLSYYLQQGAGCVMIPIKSKIQNELLLPLDITRGNEIDFCVGN